MLGIFAIGAGIVIIAGGIDLSSGSMIAFGGSICCVVVISLAKWVAPDADDPTLEVPKVDLWRGHLVDVADGILGRHSTHMVDHGGRFAAVRRHPGIFGWIAKLGTNHEPSGIRFARTPGEQD